ncbi:MAG TPA: hypothetical protein VLC09_20350 [Polyangiaceae bacterium]|nr:hypothetical protein [Polyangiaceae bacterium]
MPPARPIDPGLPTARAHLCPTCGAPWQFVVAEQLWRCDHCGTSEASGALASGVEGGLGEPRPLSELETSRAIVAEGTVTVHCSQCGAEACRPATCASFECLYCLADSAIHPDGEHPAFDALVPFVVTPAQASAHVFAYLKGAWFAPRGLWRAARVETLRNTYLPLWQLSGRLSARYDAVLGILTTAAEDRAAGHQRPAGDPGHVRTRREKVAGTLLADFEVTESASRTVSTRELTGLGELGLDCWVPFSSGYLTEHEAEFATIGPSEALQSARARLLAEQEAAARAQLAHADEIKKVDLSLETRDERGRLVLVPVYVVACRYRSEVFRILVNGATGTVDGDYPISTFKMLTLLGAIAVGIAWLVAKLA